MPPPESRKTIALVAAIGGGGLLLTVAVVVAIATSGTTATLDVGPPPAPPVAKPPASTSKTAPPARGTSLEDRIEEATERDRGMAEKYRTRHRLWTALLADARGTSHEASITEHLEQIESAANKAYRELVRPLLEETRRLPARDARAKLAAWTVPEEMDIFGTLATEHRRELEAYDELVALADARAKLDGSTDPEPALAKYLRSAHVAVRAEAERAVAELRVAYRLSQLQRKMEARRSAALARIEIVKQEIARDAAAERDRLAGWERRLKEATARRPFSLKPFGIDYELDVRVAKFDGRSVTFAAEGVEFGFGLDELHSALYGHLMQLATDPKNGRDLFEAGKLVIRREAYDAASKLFDQARRADPSLEAVAPDIARIRRGIASLEGDVAVAGSTLTVRYAGRGPDEAKDFATPPEVSLSTRGGLSLSGKGLFYASPKDLKFSGRARIACDTSHVGQSFMLGGQLEPSGETIIVEWTQQGLWRVQSLHRDREPRVLKQGEGLSGAVEMRFESPNVSVRGGWAGNVGEFTSVRPMFGGIAYDGAHGTAGYRSVTFEGRVSGSWIQRLRAERSAILESELAKEGRTTKEERAAADLVGARAFGADPIIAAIPLERELASIQPPRVAEYLDLVRKALVQMSRAKDGDLWSDLAGRAEEMLGQAIQEAPWYPLTWYYRAEWRYMLGDDAGALADLEEAARRSPSFVEARLARAELLLDQHRRAEAARELDAALDAVPDLARARQSRALLHYYEGRPQPAVAEIELAMRLEPGNLALRRQCKRLRSVVAGPLWSESTSLETKHYSLRAEVPKVARKAQAQAAAAVKEKLARFGEILEEARRYYATLMPGKPAPVMKPVMYFFATAESYYVYADFTQEDRMEHTAGVFLPAYRQMLFFEEESEEGTVETMIHEGFHEYANAVAPHIPTWLNEGMAEYAAGVTIRSGRVADTGRVMKGRLRVMKAAFDEGFAGVPFELLMRASPQQFYGAMADINYAQAWSMIHFFRHGRYADVLERYVRLIGEGKTGAEAYRETFARQDLTRMRAEWKSYVQGLR